MSDPNRPRRSPSGAQHWRDDDPQAPRERDPRSPSRTRGDSTRPPGGSTRSPREDERRDDLGPRTRLPSRDDNARTSRDRDADGRHDAPSRQPSRTRAIPPEDERDNPRASSGGWADEPRPRSGGSRPGNGSRSGSRSDSRAGDDARSGGSRADSSRSGGSRPGNGSRSGGSRADGSRSDRDRWDDGWGDGWDDKPARSARRHGSSVGVSHRDGFDDARDPHGPAGWDDQGWESKEWDNAWDDNGWGAADNHAKGGRVNAASDDDVWQPASQRDFGAQGSGMGARMGAAWKNATSQVASVVKHPSTLRERLRTDRKTQIIAAVLLAVVLIVMIPTPILAYSNTMALAKDGTAHLKNAENDFKALATSPTNLTIINDAQSELQRAHDDFAQLQLRVGLLTPAGLLPKVGSKISGANKLVPLAVEGTQAGVLACDALKTLVTGLKNPLGTTGGLTTADLNQVISDVDQIHTLFGQMAPIIQSLTQADLSLDPRLWTTVSGLQAKLPQVTQLVNDLDGMAHALPQLLGVGKPSTYLVLVLDSSELRPTGGFIGNFGALTLDSGRLDPGFHISDVTLIDSSVKFGNVPNQQVINIPPQYNWLKTVFQAGATDSWSLRDSNLDPNYPTTAQYAIQLYPELYPDAQKNLAWQGSTLQLYNPAKSGQFAGVITLSLGFFAQALKITGPLHVTAKGINETVTADNFVSKIHEYALGAKSTGPDNQACGVTSCSKIFTSDVVKVFMATIKANLSADLGKMGKLFYDSLHTKDVEVYLTPAPAQQMLHDLKISAEVAAPATGDSVYEVEANIGANKDNAFLKYQMNDQVSLSDSGAATHHLGWQYTWPNEPGTNPWVIPNLTFAAGSPNYHSYSRIFTPPNAKLISHSNNIDGFGVGSEFNRNVFHGAAYDYPFQTTNYNVAWSVPNAVIHDSAGYHYHLIFQREAGIIWPLTLTVQLPSCVTTANPPVTSGLTTPDDTVTVKGNTVTIKGPLTQDEQFQFDWTC